MRIEEVVENYECIKQKRKGAELLHEKLSKMTPEERRAYWERRNREMCEWQRELRRKMGLPE
ncbi:MAG: hypothetical protein HRF49_07810 [bacterium]|jgi:hypothetical protein